MFEISLIDGINLMDGGDLADLAGGDWGLDPGPQAFAVLPSEAFAVLPSEAFAVLPSEALRMPEPPPPPPPPPSEGIRWGDMFFLIAIFVVLGGAFLYFEARPAPEKTP